MATQPNSSSSNRRNSRDFFLHHVNVDRFVLKGSIYLYRMTMERFVVNAIILELNFDIIVVVLVWVQCSWIGAVMVWQFLLAIHGAFT